MWDARTRALLFVDIKGRRLHRYGIDSGDHAHWDMPEPLCWLIPRAREPGYIAGFARRYAFLRLDPLVIEPIAVAEPDRPRNRLNDAKADSFGRVWAGSMDDAEKQISGALYRLDPDLTFNRVDDGYAVANGPTFSPAGDLLYHTDSAARVIYRFDLSPDGELRNKAVFVRFEEAWGHPDGMTTDADGGVWIAHWDGARVSRFTPEGELDRSVPLPVSRPTSCAFAGDHLERLFVTSAAVGRESEELAGGLFEIDAGVRGARSYPFGG
jgi:sugar lactone lactonase YvrE